MALARLSRPAALAAAGAASACVALAAAGAATAAPPAPIASRPTTTEAWAARVILPVHARSEPRSSARMTAKIPVTAPYDGGPNVLLVLAARVSPADGVWYRVRLTDRPNTASGWIPAAAVRVTRTPWRVVVRLRTRTLELLRGGRPVGRWSVAIGTPADPTPAGRFAISEVVRQRTPNGFFGSYIITLTAHSEHLSEFDGGDGRVALHGTNQPSLLGQAVSHGCVRMANAVATRIGRTVPPGSPVDVIP